MALLNYWNVESHRPDILMQRAFFGLKPFYDFLSATRTYMETDAAVLRLAWGAGFAPEHEQNKAAKGKKGNKNQQPVASAGVWVALEEPKDRPNEPESTFSRGKPLTRSAISCAAVSLNFCRT